MTATDQKCFGVDWFLEHQLPDGGWNCEWVEGSTRSSFHSTLNSLNGLLAYDAVAGTDATRAARRAAEEYLLFRRLFRRLSTGDPVVPWVDRFAYPFRWSHTAGSRSTGTPAGRGSRSTRHRENRRSG